MKLEEIRWYKNVALNSEDGTLGRTPGTPFLVFMSSLSGNSQNPVFCPYLKTSLPNKSRFVSKSEGTSLP